MLQVSAPCLDMTLSDLQDLATRQQQQINTQQQLLASKVQLLVLLLILITITVTTFNGTILQIPKTHQSHLLQLFSNTDQIDPLGPKLPVGPY